MAETSVVRYLDNPGLAQQAGCLPLPDYEKWGSPVPTKVYCKENCKTLYCSEECREDAWQKYHKYICLGLTKDENYINPLHELQKLCAVPATDAAVNPLWPLMILRMLAMERIVAEEEDADLENADSQLFCSRCGVGQQESLLLRCSACESAYYCDELCQKSHWRYHKPHCNTPLPGDEVEAQPARLRVFGRFMHSTADGAATAYRKAMQLLGSKETITTTDVEGNELPCPMQFDPEFLQMEKGGQTRVALWKHHVSLIRQSSLYSAKYDDLFTLKTYVRFWSLLTLNATGVSPTSRFLNYFFRIVADVKQRGEMTPIAKQLQPLMNQLQKHGKRVESCVGAGLFPIQSAVNHSCIFNAEFRYNHLDNTLAVVAIRDVEKDTELVVNYLSVPGQASDTMTRRTILALQYEFCCRCRLCTLDDKSTETKEKKDEKKK